MKTGIIVFAFGQPSTISSNKYLADCAKQLAIRYGVKYVFTQRDISINSISNIINVKYVEENKEPPSTLFIAEKSLNWAKNLGLKKVMVIAAPPHADRCMRDLSKIYAGTEIKLVLYQTAYNSSLWYDHQSAQLRTRNKFFWWSRESILTAMPFWLYKKVAR